MKLKYYDWFLFGFLAVLAVSVGSAVVSLLAVIAALLYLIVRRYFSGSKNAAIAISPPEVIEFVVDSSNKDGFTNSSIIELDVDLNGNPCPSHFRYDTQFDVYFGESGYEYKIDGTSVSVRLLSAWRSSPDEVQEEWKVRDGVVLESDLRTRYEAKKFKWGSVDVDIADLKSQTEWHDLTSWAFNGFKYFLLNRVLPRPDARRYLRQELERLKLGIAQATHEYAAYGLEPDPDPESITGWRWIGGKEPEDAKDTQPFWDKVESGAFGITLAETGRDGRQLIVDLQKMLGG